MACFIAPMGLAIVTTVFRKKIPENLKIGWLNIMIWGGVIMLAVEHIAHGEVVLYPPFLTAMQTPAEIPVMLQEMAIVGGTMTIAIVCIWLVMVYLYNKAPQIQNIKLLKN
jgi:hypothetical protein